MDLIDKSLSTPLIECKTAEFFVNGCGLRIKGRELTQTTTATAVRTSPNKKLNEQQSRPQSPRPLDQRSGSAWALVESKTGTRKSWFRFDSARASEIVVEMNKFQQPMRFGRFHGGLSV